MLAALAGPTTELLRDTGVSGPRKPQEEEIPAGQLTFVGCLIAGPTM